MSKQKLSIGIVFLAEILVLGMLLAMIFKGSRTVQVLSPSVAEWESRYTSFDGNAWNGTPELITEDLPEKDDLALIYGPFLPLPRGMYDVCVEYTCDTDQTVSIYSAENSDRIHLLGTDSLPAKKQVCTYHFYTTRDIPDLEVHMKYNGIGNLSIRNILITTSVFFYKPAFIFLAAVFVLTDLLIFKRKSKSSGKAVELMRFRSIWMAFAMLYVMLYHSGIRFDRHVVDAVLDSGYGGVDIFFCATGIGCYLSYIKDSDAGAFLKRRMLRLLPAYFCFMIPWCAYKIIVDHMPFSSLIGNLFSIEGIKGTGFAFNWYVSAVWIFYILTPFLATFICKRITSFYRCLLLIGAALLLSAALGLFGMDHHRDQTAGHDLRDVCRKALYGKDAHVLPV